MTTDRRWVEGPPQGLRLGAGGAGGADECPDCSLRSRNPWPAGSNRGTRAVPTQGGDP